MVAEVAIPARDHGVLVPLDIVRMVLQAVVDDESVTMIELAAALGITEGFRNLAGLAFDVCLAHQAFQAAINQETVDEGVKYDEFVEAMERFTAAIQAWSAPYRDTPSPAEGRR